MLQTIFYSVWRFYNLINFHLGQMEDHLIFGVPIVKHFIAMMVFGPIPVRTILMTEDDEIKRKSDLI